MPRREKFDIGDILHVYNRGVDKRTTFELGSDYMRFGELLWFCNLYNYSYSRYRDHKKQAQSKQQDAEEIFRTIDHHYRYPKSLCSVVAYAFMPNHYHLVLQETQDRGISKFMSKIINAYTKYFNTKNERSGNLFSGAYKHVSVKKEEQLLHLSRYVHINPTAAGLASVFDLKDYQWSSLPEYLGEAKEEDNAALCDAKDLVLSHFKSRQTYLNFVTAEFREDEAAYKLEDLTLDDDFGWYKAAK